MLSTLMCPQPPVFSSRIWIWACWLLSADGARNRAGPDEVSGGRPARSVVGSFEVSEGRAGRDRWVQHGARNVRVIAAADQEVQIPLSDRERRRGQGSGAGIEIVEA